MKVKLGKYIQPCEERNGKQYGIENLKGISIQKKFIESKADMDGVPLSSYIVVKPDYFAYVTITSRNGEKITLAYNNSQDTYIVSSSYIVFSISKPKELDSEYLFMYFNRPEFDRYARFNSWGSARETFSWDEMRDIEIDLPDIEVQRKFVAVYKAMVENQKAYESGLEDLKLTYDAETMNRVVETMVEKAIQCTGIENIIDGEPTSPKDIFGAEMQQEALGMKLPITKFNALVKLLRKAITGYGKKNKIKALEFDERLKKVVEKYNNRDLIFTSEVVADFINDLSEEIIAIFTDLETDKKSFEKLGVSFEEKVFYDILIKVRDEHGFDYSNEKCIILAKEIKKLVDDKAQYADWSCRDDIKHQLRKDLILLLRANGYPPTWNNEVFEQVMEQAQNFKRWE